MQDAFSAANLTKIRATEEKAAEAVSGADNKDCRCFMISQSNKDLMLVMLHSCEV